MPQDERNSKPVLGSTAAGVSVAVGLTDVQVGDVCSLLVGVAAVEVRESFATEVVLVRNFDFVEPTLDLVSVVLSTDLPSFEFAVVDGSRLTELEVQAGRQRWHDIPAVSASAGT